MKKTLFVLFFLSVSYFTKAQTVSFYGQQINVDSLCPALNFSNNDEARKCMDNICSVAGIVNNFITVPCDRVDNCQAIQRDGDGYILYNNNFLERLRPLGFAVKTFNTKKYDWSTIAVFAHELGHLANNHFGNAVRHKYTLIQLELQADTYSGGILYKLGASLEEAQKAMYDKSVTEEGDLTHPGRKERLAAIANGWNKAKGEVKVVEKQVVVEKTVENPVVTNPSTQPVYNIAPLPENTTISTNKTNINDEDIKGTEGWKVFEKSSPSNKNTHLWGFKNANGKVVIQPKFQYAFNFSEGLALVSLNDKYGYVNKTGEITIPCIYDFANNFIEGLAAVTLNKKHGFIDKNQEIVIQFKYDYVHDFDATGLASVEINNKWGFINKAGETIIPFIYDDAHNFYPLIKDKWVSTVKLNGKWGYIDTKGNWIKDK